MRFGDPGRGITRCYRAKGESSRCLECKPRIDQIRRSFSRRPLFDGERASTMAAIEDNSLAVLGKRSRRGQAITKWRIWIDFSRSWNRVRCRGCCVDGTFLHELVAFETA